MILNCWSDLSWNSFLTCLCWNLLLYSSYTIWKTTILFEVKDCLSDFLWCKDRILLSFFIKSQEVKTSFLKHLCSREISATIGRNRAVLSKAMLSVAQGSRWQMMAEPGTVVYWGLHFSKARSSNNTVAKKKKKRLLIFCFGISWINKCKTERKKSYQLSACPPSLYVLLLLVCLLVYCLSP